MIKNIIFDLDDTLYRELDFVNNGFREVAKYLSEITLLKEQVIYFMILDIFKKCGRGKVFDLLLDELRLKIDVDYLVNIYRKNNGDLKLYKDAKVFLDKSKENYNLGLITDGNSIAQWNKIKSLGLDKIFDEIIVTGDLGEEYYKPCPISYELMLKKFGGNAREYVYIGDNPKKDFIAAKNLGMKTIRIIRDSGDFMNIKMTDEYEADIKVEKLEEKIWNYL